MSLYTDKLFEGLDTAAEGGNVRVFANGHSYLLKAIGV
jgi:hypothetical protein